MPGAALTVMLPGQDGTGFSSSFTVTLKLQLTALPSPSIAVQVTVVLPLENAEPEAGLQLVVTLATFGQPLDVVGLNATTAEQSPVPSELVVVVMFPGQTME